MKGRFFPTIIRNTHVSYEFIVQQVSDIVTFIVRLERVISVYCTTSKQLMSSVYYATSKQCRLFIMRLVSYVVCLLCDWRVMLFVLLYDR